MSSAMLSALQPELMKPSCSKWKFFVFFLGSGGQNMLEGCSMLCHTHLSFFVLFPLKACINGILKLLNAESLCELFPTLIPSFSAFFFTCHISELFTSKLSQFFQFRISKPLMYTIRDTWSRPRRMSTKRGWRPGKMASGVVQLMPPQKHKQQKMLHF